MRRALRIAWAIAVAIPIFQTGPMGLSKARAQDSKFKEFTGKTIRTGAAGAVDALELAARRSGASRAATAFEQGGGAFELADFYDNYKTGRTKGQDPFQAGTRATVGWALADLGMQAGVELCVGSAGVLCTVGAGMIIGSGLAMFGMYTYDTVLARHSDK